MGRHLRFVPEGALVEITCRTVQERFLLRPSPLLNAIFLGVLGRAQARYEMVIHAFVALSNHVHLLLSPESPQQLAAFMAFFSGNLAREVGWLHGWEGPIWSRRYRSILVSDEMEAQVARLLYIFRHGVKEHLVRRPQDWPGAHTIHALLDGKPLEGLWFDRTREDRLRRRHADFDQDLCRSLESVQLAPLPCWRHLEPAEHRNRVADLLVAVEEEGRRLEAENGPPPGGKRILCQSPLDRPEASKRTHAPLVHAACRRVRLAWIAAYRAFALAFRQAAERLRNGDRLVRFPDRSFPPPLPAPT